MEGYTTHLFCFIFLSLLILSTATDTIATDQSIKDSETIVSSGGVFELGFFSTGNSNSGKRYVGIWYKVSVATVVWVANRETPVVDSPGVLMVTNQGLLVILSQNNTIIWSSNSSSESAQSPVAQLLDSGNLVVRNENNTNPDSFLWQSFDYPRDTQLPGMKWGRNKVSRLDWYLSSWKSNDDPAEGEYTFKLDLDGLPQFFLRKSSAIQYRSGPWNGLRFSGKATPNLNPTYNISLVINDDEVYYTYEPLNRSVLQRTLLNQEGIIQRFQWDDQKNIWILYLSSPSDLCDTYAFCGVHGSCNIGNSPECGCLKGFEPNSPKDWELANWSKGCVRRTPLTCKEGDGFVTYSGVKVPDTRHSWFNRSMTLEECKILCLKNCSCTAYTSLDISTKEGSGCLLWTDDLIDIRQFTQDGQDIYIKLASSEIDLVASNEKKQVRIIVSSVLLVVAVLSLGVTLYVWKKKKKKEEKLTREGKEASTTESGHSTVSRNEDLELPLFDLATLANATNNFSFNNKLGEGGFGPVYKGVLEEGKEIAVKKLSETSRQGLDEYKNEVMCIAKLQHRNLVKLLGYCIEEEKMLIYEYMSNKSLDYFIFDQTLSASLNLGKRIHIINGIARGLLYLHQDSRLRIIHRDLKASNILLDSEMNPKISDFGLARIFGGNETEAKTNRVIGTYGYMSPEYAAKGIFSVKSDVFSFGVLVLEIVSGKRNRDFDYPNDHLNLLGHAWRLSRDGKVSNLVDDSLEESYNFSEVLRSVHVGLLCVQQYPEDRPSMSSVVQMLGSESALPQPKLPGFYTERNMPATESSSSKREKSSSNKLTITLLEAR